MVSPQVAFRLIPIYLTMQSYKFYLQQHVSDRKKLVMVFGTITMLQPSNLLNHNLLTPLKMFSMYNCPDGNVIQ